MRPLSPFLNADIRTSLFSADVLKKCALIALHVNGRRRKIWGWISSPLSWEEEWKMGCPKRPMWEGEGAACLEDENASSSSSREGNVCNDALHGIGLHGPGDKISLFLQDWELAKVAPSCHMALDMLCQELNGPWQRVRRCEKDFCHSNRSLSLTVDGL